MPANTPRGYTYPLYSDPANYAAQNQDFAQDVDADVQALEVARTNALNAPSGRAIASANQSIPVNTSTLATFATETYDNAAMVNLGVSNTRITLTSAGLYIINAECNWVPNGNATVGERAGRILGNLASTDPCWSSSRGSQLADTELSLTCLYYTATAGDFVTFSVWHNSGAAVNISARSFSATKVAT